jgi:hypothetical protein
MNPAKGQKHIQKKTFHAENEMIGFLLIRIPHKPLAFIDLGLNVDGGFRISTKRQFSMNRPFPPEVMPSETE